MDRRQFLTAALASGAGLALGPAVWRAAIADPILTATDGPYGPLLAPDANGVRLPAGFTSKVIARSEQVVAGTAYVWHHAPDGGATFPTQDGGWIYVSNSEVPSATGGGASAIRFAADGTIVDAYRILAGTSLNCAGGAVGREWLSCEEHEGGLVWRCDPTKPGTGTPLPALGTFAHEAVAADRDGRLYLTEDEPDGLFYRFTPAVPGNFSAGTLEAAKWLPSGHVEWLAVPRPNLVPGTTATRHQVPGATVFRGGEGCYYHDAAARGGVVYITTKGDNRVWAYKPAQRLLEVVYDAGTIANAPLRGVDNVTVTQSGDVVVAEDGDDLQICVLSGTTVYPLLQVVGHERSEIAGPAFSPDGTRLYFSSQRGPAIATAPFEDGAGQANPVRPGVTFEVTGPF
ncbi:MAG TPA: alkaline phosphatase PhoX [Acidimicrobiales bacterium]